MRDLFKKIFGSGDHLSAGRSAEREATGLLAAKGYKILATDFRARGGEVDIIAASGGVLVFVEVKARRNADYGGAHYAISQAKRGRIVSASLSYIKAKKPVFDSLRFDAVLFCGGQVEHIEDAFTPSEEFLF
ncbi:MAG: YraN family protein [Elusimicrobiaceae bacterium]